MAAARPRQPRWITTLRHALQQDNGRGWTVWEARGHVQLCHRGTDGTRETQTLAIPWNGECIPAVLGTVAQLRSAMKEQGVGLKHAHALLQQNSVVTRAGPATQPRIDWPLLVEGFRSFKLSSGAVKASTFERMYEPVMQAVLAELAASPAPADAPELFERLVKAYGGETGSKGRQLRLLYTAQLLRFALKQGAPGRWKPPEDLADFIGRRSADSLRRDSTPIKDRQLVALLESITDARWRLAIGLIGCFGLRPVELRFCRADGNWLVVDYRKRTARGSTPPRRVRGLDPEGMEGESTRLLSLLESQALPPLGTDNKGAGAAVHQFLERCSAWQRLRAEARSRGEILTPYGLRHGYALRAHQRGLAPRLTASLMGHSLQTHCRHYGNWTDAETIDAAFEKIGAAAA